MNSQVSITSDLRIAASGICNRVCSLERERNERAWPANVDVAAVTTQAMPLVSAVKEVLTHGEKSAAETATPTVPAPEVYAGAAAERSLRGQQSPKWSEVVKRSRRATTDEANAGGFHIKRLSSRSPCFYQPNLNFAIAIGDQVYIARTIDI
uniref:Uncharacterized protein n=1 Tax=Knipowitschia caucasica TaxID=637954 RepID=A0AAV2KB90_KNICA